MSIILFCKGFEEQRKRYLSGKKNPLGIKFEEIIKDLEKNGCTYQGSIKLIPSKGGIKYLRAKLSDSGRLLFTSMKYNNEDAFIMLEVIPNHDYSKSVFLKSNDITKTVEIEEMKATEISSTVEIKDLERGHWLGKLVTFSATQEDIVENVEGCKLPLVISGAAGSGKTSVALESLKKMQEKFKERKILYITKSANLIKESKKFFECERYDGTTGESKTYIPEEIEFLSLHEFLERREEDIKGKRPIDRNKFFSWFSEICKKDKFKEYKKDGDKIFEEFTAVIAGRGLTKEQYKESGRRQAIFPEEKRDHVYGLFEKYKEFIGKNLEHYDANFIANQCNEKKVYDAVVIDEVQDLTKIVLDLILKSLKDESKGNFLLCGDVNQVIHPSFFSLPRLKSSLSNKYEEDQKLKLYNLEKDYRNSKQVIELANRILHFKNYCFAPEDKMTEEEKELFFMESDKENEGNIGFIPRGKEQEIAGKVSNSTKYAVLVLDDESKKEARKLFGTPLVFNIHEAKGLEFENVILYKFMSNKAYDEIWKTVHPNGGNIENTINEIRGSYNEKNVKISRNKNKEDKSFEKYKFYMNALYVGVTRAIDSVYIIDDDSNLLKVIKPQGGKIINIEDIKKEESTSEEWRDMALKLIDEGNIEQAKNIAVKKLPSKKEYIKKIIDALNHQKCDREEAEKCTKEIISALEAKERNVEVTAAQSPLDKPCSIGDTIFGKVKKQLEVEKALVTAAKDSNIETTEDERIGVNVKDLKEQTPLEKDKRIVESEKEKKKFDEIMREEKAKIANNLMKSIKLGELVSFKDDLAKEIYVEYCTLEMLGKVITSILEPKIEKKHREFNNKRSSSFSYEESNSELVSIIAGKKYLKQCKDASVKAKNLVEQMFVDLFKILAEKQTDRNKKYRFQILEKKLGKVVKDIEEVKIAELEECIAGYTDEELGLKLDIISQELKNNMEKLKDWTSQDIQKNKQEYKQKNNKMLGKKMQKMLKKKNVDLLSWFVPKEIVDEIVQLAENLPERMKICINKMVDEHENLKKKCQSSLSEKLSLSEFEKLRDEAIDITDRFIKLCDKFHSLINKGEELKQQKDLLDILKILEEWSEAHSEETFQSNSNLSGVSVSNHSIQVRGECSKQK